MKVKELIELLLKANQEAEVVLSSDDEGNSFRIADSVDTNSAFESDGFDLEVGIKNLTADLKRRGFTKEDCVVGEDCVVIW